MQLPVTVLLKVSHFLDDITRGTVNPSYNILTYCKCEFLLYMSSIWLK